MTSIAAYNKLCAIITGKVPNPEKDKKAAGPAKQSSMRETGNTGQNAQDQSKAEMTLASYLF